MFMHVTLLGVLSPEEVITIIDFVYITVPLEVDELAMGKTLHCVCQRVYV